jgi:hypothetical protein
MNQVIPFAQEQDITVVIPTGNDAPNDLDSITPQNLGTTANGLITVGGVEKNGALFPDTNPDLGSGGSISIYAAARDVLVAGIDSDSATAEVTGTSLAAPAVAGMAAYFFSLQELDANWPSGSVARAMKQFFVLSARVQRNNNPVPDNLGYTPPSAGSIVVAWNRHPGNALGLKGKATRRPSRPLLPVSHGVRHVNDNDDNGSHDELGSLFDFDDNNKQRNNLDKSTALDNQRLLLHHHVRRRVFMRGSPGQHLRPWQHDRLSSGQTRSARGDGDDVLCFGVVCYCACYCCSNGCLSPVGSISSHHTLA